MSKDKTKKILIIMSMMIGVLFLTLIYMLFVDPMLNPPSKDSNIEITRNVKPLEIPSEITAGKVFRYHSEGEKMVDVSATVRRQLVCKNDGAESIIMIDEIESNLPIGKYSFDREMVIPATQRLKNSDQCRLEFTSTYTFFKRDRWQSQSSFQIKKTNRSNDFKLIVPDLGRGQYLDNAMPLQIAQEPDGIIVSKIHTVPPMEISEIRHKNDVKPVANINKSNSADNPSADERSTVKWKYKVISTAGIQLGVYNLAINAIIKYNYVDGKAKIYDVNGLNITEKILLGIIK